MRRRISGLIETPKTGRPSGVRHWNRTAHGMFHWRPGRVRGGVECLRVACGGAPATPAGRHTTVARHVPPLLTSRVFPTHFSKGG